MAEMKAMTQYKIIFKLDSGDYESLRQLARFCTLASADFGAFLSTRKKPEGLTEICDTTIAILNADLLGLTAEREWYRHPLVVALVYEKLTGDPHTRDEETRGELVKKLEEISQAETPELVREFLKKLGDDFHALKQYFEEKIPNEQREVVVG
ncbi:hypothetical protein HYW76_03265 [Candidatus Pacearchaeota archaeon]|nr:hypothetical protein [Candidatus Pacearchaeota archaeon]